MKRIICFLISVLLIVFSFSACGNNEAEKDTENYGYSALTDEAASVLKNNSVSSAETYSRKLITTVSVLLETEHYNSSVGKITSCVTDFGGYIEYSNEIAHYSSKLRTAEYTVRIPAEKTDEFLSAIDESGTVMNKNVTTSDVTLQYSDTEAHLEALKTEQETLLELLSKATALSDILEIQRELTSVRSEIETCQKRLILYDNQVDYSTVNLTVNEVKEELPENPGAFKRITRGLSNSLKNIGYAFGECIIWIISSLPYIVIIAGVLAILFAVCRKVRNKKAKKKIEDKSGES